MNLKKIASFYNNMNDEIIDCQKGMVLKELQNFEECVKNVNSQMKSGDELTWDKPTNV
jgi:dynein heavy chain 2